MPRVEKSGTWRRCDPPTPYAEGASESHSCRENVNELSGSLADVVDVEAKRTGLVNQPAQKKMVDQCHGLRETDVF
jgi:hypothetical protein